MADGTIIKWFVFGVTLLGIFVYLVGSMPAGMMYSSPDYVPIEPESYFTAYDIGNVKWTIEKNVTYNDLWNEYDFDAVEAGLPKFYLMYGSVGFMDPAFYLHYVKSSWWIFVDTEQMSEITKQYSSLNSSRVGEFVVNVNDYNTSKFKMKSSQSPTARVYITDYNLTRNDPEAAIEAHETLTITLGLGYDDLAAKQGSWDAIAQLLTFQTPDTESPITTIISISLWAIIAILVYMLILMAIPFVGG